MVNSLTTSKSHATLVQEETFKPPSLSETEGVVNKCISIIELPMEGLRTLYKIIKCYSISDDLKDRMDKQSSNMSFISSTFQLPKLFFNQFKFYYACDELKKSVESGSDVPASKVFKKFNTVLARADTLTGSGQKVAQLLQKLRFFDFSEAPGGFAQGKAVLSLSASGTALVDSIWTLRDQINKERAKQSEEAGNWSLERKKEIRNVASKTTGLIKHLDGSVSSTGKNLISLSSSLVSSVNSIWSLSDQLEKEQGGSNKSEKLSLGTKKEIRAVATNAINLILNIIQTSALIFCTRTNPFTLALFSTVCFGLSVVKFAQENDGYSWGGSRRLQIKSSSHLPA